MSQTDPQEEVDQSAEPTNPFQRFKDLAGVPLEGQLAEDWDAQAQPGTPG